jgi:hypothetical protein
MEGGGKEGGVDMLEVYYAHMYESIMKPTENCKKTNKQTKNWVPVAHTYNPSYLGG